MHYSYRVTIHFPVWKCKKIVCNFLHRLIVFRCRWDHSGIVDLHALRLCRALADGVKQDSLHIAALHCAADLLARQLADGQRAAATRELQVGYQFALIRLL